MISAADWKLNQQNMITFPLVDGMGNEISGLGTTWTLQISKAGGAFGAGTGTKAEISLGAYSYLTSNTDANTIGPALVRITGAGIVTQWLEYCVEQRTPLSVSFTYTVTDDVTLLPIDAVCVQITTDSAGANIVWTGYTDSLGVLRDSNGQLPRLDPGVYFFWRQLSGRIFQNPDQESVP